MGTNCMDPAVLAAYMEGGLSDAERADMERHLIACDICLETVAATKMVLAEMDLSAYGGPAPMAVVSAVIDQVRGRMGLLWRWVLDLAPPPWMTGGVPVMVRSAAAAVAIDMEPAIWITKDMEGVRAEIYIRRVREDRVSLAVRVANGARSRNNVCLTLAREGGGMQARYVTAEYEIFDRLRMGIYHLIVEQDAREKGSYVFQIDDDGFHER